MTKSFSANVSLTQLHYFVNPVSLLLNMIIAVNSGQEKHHDQSPLCLCVGRRVDSIHPTDIISNMQSIKQMTAFVINIKYQGAYYSGNQWVLKLPETQIAAGSIATAVTQ